MADRKENIAFHARNILAERIEKMQELLEQAIETDTIPENNSSDHDMAAVLADVTIAFAMFGYNPDVWALRGPSYLAGYSREFHEDFWRRVHLGQHNTETTTV